MNPVPWKIDLPAGRMLAGLAAGVILARFSAEFLLLALLLIVRMAPPVEEFDAKLSRRHDGRQIVFTVVVLTVLALAGQALFGGLWLWFLNRTGIDAAVTQEHVKMLLEGPRALRTIAFVNVVVLAPLVEELLFRRMLYGLLLPYAGMTGAMFLQAGLFSVAHWFIAGIPGLFWYGLLFQFAYLHTGSIRTPIAMHVVLNLIATGLLFWGIGL